MEVGPSTVPTQVAKSFFVYREETELIVQLAFFVSAHSSILGTQALGARMFASTLARSSALVAVLPAIRFLCET